MSPVVKPKSKSVARAAKVQAKSPSKPNMLTVNAAEVQAPSFLYPTMPAARGTGITADSYNPVLGTFNALETVPSSSSHFYQNNGCIRRIDERDDLSRTPLRTTTEEYGLIFNNISSREQRAPGSEDSNNDKRNKIRLMNEKKHQRKKEKKAQELHKCCRNCLMFRKLKAHEKELAGMGFTSERATKALMLNKGRMTNSVEWLLECDGESEQQDMPDDLNLDVDITEELQSIANMVIGLECTEQEVERAVVACDGDLVEASKRLSSEKENKSVLAPKVEELEDQVSPEGKSVAVTSTMEELENLKGNSMAVTHGVEELEDQRSSVSKGKGHLEVSEAHSLRMKAIPPARIQQNRRGGSDLGSALPESSSMRNVPAWRSLQPESNLIDPQAGAMLDARGTGGNSRPPLSYPLQPPAQEQTSVSDKRPGLPCGIIGEPIPVKPITTMLPLQLPPDPNPQSHHSSTQGSLQNPIDVLRRKNLAFAMSQPRRAPDTASGAPMEPRPVRGRLVKPLSLGLFTAPGDVDWSTPPPGVDWSTTTKSQSLALRPCHPSNTGSSMAGVDHGVYPEGLRDGSSHATGPYAPGPSVVRPDWPINAASLSAVQNCRGITPYAPDPLGWRPDSEIAPYAHNPLGWRPGWPINPWSSVEAQNRNAIPYVPNSLLQRPDLRINPWSSVEAQNRDVIPNVPNPLLRRPDPRINPLSSLAVEYICRPPPPGPLFRPDQFIAAADESETGADAFNCMKKG